MSDWFCLAPSDFIAVFLLLNTCFGEDSVFITSLNYVEKVHFLHPLDICTVILQIHGNQLAARNTVHFTELWIQLLRDNVSALLLQYSKLQS